MRNIEACKQVRLARARRRSHGVLWRAIKTCARSISPLTAQLAAITRTSLGPNAMRKLVINHLEKLFVTSDAATMKLSGSKPRTH